MTGTRVALVTGGARGIGLEICRALIGRGARVVLSDRDERRGEEAVDTLRAVSSEVAFCPLDVTCLDDVERARRRIEREFGRLDILVNSVRLDCDRETVLEAQLDLVRRSFEVNTVALLRLLQTFVPWMIDRDYGRVVNLASEEGTFASMERADSPAFRISSAGTIAITRMIAAEAVGTNVLVNCVDAGPRGDPEDPKSAFGTPDPIQRTTDTAIWLATLPDGGPRGGLFRDRAPLDW